MRKAGSGLLILKTPYHLSTLGKSFSSRRLLIPWRELDFSAIHVELPATLHCDVATSVVAAVSGRPTPKPVRAGTSRRLFAPARTGARRHPSSVTPRRPGAPRHQIAHRHGDRSGGLGPANRCRHGRPDSRPNLPGIAVPTLILVGDGDPLTPPERSQEMANAIPVPNWWSCRPAATDRRWSNRTLSPAPSLTGCSAERRGRGLPAARANQAKSSTAI